MSKEVKIGLFVIATLAIGVWGFKYLTGNNVLSNSTIIKAKYNNIEGIRRSTPILFKGYQIGLVSDIYPEDANYENIIVEMNIDEGINVDRAAIMQITTTSLMGDKAVVLLNNADCSLTNNCVESGDFVQGTTRGILGSMLGTDDLSDYMKVLTQELKSLFKVLEDEMQKGGNKIGGALNDFTIAMENAKNLTGRLDRLMASSSGNIQGTLANLNTLSDTLVLASSDIKMLMANAEEFTADLKQADIVGTVGEAKKVMTNLQTTLINADNTLKNVQKMVNQMKSGDGAVSMLINDPQFADKLKLTITDLDLFLQDLRLHPERYRRILSKKTKEYEVPTNDPARQLKD